MKITNKSGLPASIMRAVTAHTHVGADYSATQLLKSPRQLHLERRHDDEIEVDASERIWAMLGTAAHLVAQFAEGEQDLVETYMEQEVEGVKVSGTADLYEHNTRTLTDFKNTSAWTIVYASRMAEWSQQVNIYAWLLHKQGFNAEKLQIIAFLRDWQATKAEHDPSYPQSNVVVIPIEKWEYHEVEDFIRMRVRVMESAAPVEDDDLPFCTDEERWKDETVFAVMKKGRKSAVKLHTNPLVAKRHAEDLGPDHSIQERPGLARRCVKYCPAAQFCNQKKMEDTV